MHTQPPSKDFRGGYTRRVRTLKIGYQPYSPDLNHPADRRRLLHWAKIRGHEIVLDLDQKFDVLFLSGRSDFTKLTRRHRHTPIILDLVDGYLGDEDLWRDWLRGAGKVLMGHNSGIPRQFRKIVSEACSLSQAVACETIEQRETIIPFCANTHPILDFHEEFPMRKFNKTVLKTNKPTLLWEGLPFTAKGLLQLEKFFTQAAVTKSVTLEMVTNLEYPLLFGKYFLQDTKRIIGEIPSVLGNNFKITEWSLQAVVEAAAKSHIAVLPLDPSASLNHLKAENRLLMMWRVGLPVLASPSLAYSRVMKTVDVDGICSTPEQWDLKISELLESQELCGELVEKGQQYIRDTHSERNVLKSWDELFESVI